MKPLDEELQEVDGELEDWFINNTTMRMGLVDRNRLSKWIESKIRQLVEEREKEFKIARAREITNLMDKDEYVKNSWCQSYIEDTEYDDSMDRADEYDEMASLVEKLDNEENGFIDPKDLPF